MDECPHCGAELPGDVPVSDEEDGHSESEESDSEAVVCSECGTSLEPTDGTTDPPWTAETSGATRREVLAYGGGSALLTWGAIGTGWFVFFYEPTGPEEDLVREYVDALDRSQFYTARQLFHEDAPGEAWTAAELPDVNEVELTVEGTEIVDRQEAVDIDTVEELALVVAEISIEGAFESQTREVGFVVAKNQDGEWKLWRDR